MQDRKSRAFFRWEGNACSAFTVQRSASALDVFALLFVAAGTSSQARQIQKLPHAIGAKNRTIDAARRLKHQIKSRLIHERRSTARPMKPYTIPATSPDTTQ